MCYLSLKFSLITIDKKGTQNNAFLNVYFYYESGTEQIFCESNHVCIKYINTIIICNIFLIFKVNSYYVHFLIMKDKYLLNVQPTDYSGCMTNYFVQFRCVQRVKCNVMKVCHYNCVQDGLMRKLVDFI